MNDRIKTFPYRYEKFTVTNDYAFKKNFRHGEKPLIFIVELPPLKNAVEFCFDKLNDLHVPTSLRHVKLCLFTN